MSGSELKSADMLAARQNTRDSIAFGTMLLVMGLIALMTPVFTGITITFLVGILLFVGGIVETIVAFRAESFGRGVLTFLFGGLSILAGIATFATPVEAQGVLTIILIVFFILSGIVDIVLAIKLRGEEGFGWILFSGILAVLLGILLIARWPASGIVAVGIYVGIKLIFRGWVLTSIGKTGQVMLTHLQDTRVEVLERHLRSVAKAVQGSQTVLADHTAMLLAMSDELKKKVSESDFDPSIVELNDQLIEARKRMETAAEARKETWDKIQQESNEAFEKLNDKVGDMTKKLKAAVGLDKKAK